MAKTSLPCAFLGRPLDYLCGFSALTIGEACYGGNPQPVGALTFAKLARGQYFILGRGSGPSRFAAFGIE